MGKCEIGRHFKKGAVARMIDVYLTDEEIEGMKKHREIRKTGHVWAGATTNSEKVEVKIHYRRD